MLLLLKLPMSKITKAKECVRRLIRDFFSRLAVVQLFFVPNSDWDRVYSTPFQSLKPHLICPSYEHQDSRQTPWIRQQRGTYSFLGLWYALRSSPIIGNYSATERTLSVRASTHPCSWASSLMSRLSWSQQEQQEATSLDSKSHSLWKRVCHWALMRW